MCVIPYAAHRDLFVVKTMCTLKLTILCLTIVLFARLSVKAQIGIAFFGRPNKVW